MLNPRQMKFVQEYLKSGVGEQAAVAAGYSPKSAKSWASRLLAMPEVQAYRRELEQKLFDEMGISRAWIGRRLVEILDRCMQAVPVMKWSETERKKVESGIYEFDANGALKAAHELYVQLGFAQGDAETAEQRQSFEAWLEAQGEGPKL